MSAVDWNAYPEPWRSIGLSFVVDLGRPTEELPSSPHSLPPESMTGVGLRMLRTSRRLSRKQLAQKIDADTLTIVNAERRRNVPADLVRAIREALK
jgi:hypothetical protein